MRGESGFNIHNNVYSPHFLVEVKYNLQSCSVLQSIESRSAEKFNTANLGFAQEEINCNRLCVKEQFISSLNKLPVWTFGSFKNLHYCMSCWTKQNSKLVIQFFFENGQLMWCPPKKISSANSHQNQQRYDFYVIFYHLLK